MEIQNLNASYTDLCFGVTYFMKYGDNCNTWCDISNIGKAEVECIFRGDTDIFVMPLRQSYDKSLLWMPHIYHGYIIRHFLSYQLCDMFTCRMGHAAVLTFTKRALP